MFGIARGICMFSSINSVFQAEHCCSICSQLASRSWSGFLRKMTQILSWRLSRARIAVSAFSVWWLSSVWASQEHLHANVNQQNCSLVTLCSGEKSPPGTKGLITNSTSILKRCTLGFSWALSGGSGWHLWWEPQCSNSSVIFFTLPPRDCWGPGHSDECLGMWQRGEALAVEGDNHVCLFIVIIPGEKSPSK